MMRLLCMPILLSIAITAKSANINKSNDSHVQVEINDTKEEKEKAEKIAALEKEREELYVKINEAIDNAIPELKLSNDTDSATGVQHLESLKQMLRQIHEADNANDTFEHSNNNTEGFRRNIQVVKLDKGKKHKQNKMFEKLMAHQKKFTGAKMMANREKIEKQLKEWLIKRREEKRRRQALAMKSLLEKENCPRQGRGKSKSKGAFGNKAKKMEYYPCCRKCCKRSYIGCL